jgi:site-specific DNA recombinase
MDPVLCDLFCQEYTRQMNRLHRENNAERKGDRSALAKIERELDRLVQALMDGVPASRVKDKMTDLENRKAGLGALERRRGQRSPSSPEHGGLLLR